MSSAEEVEAAVAGGDDDRPAGRGDPQLRHQRPHHDGHHARGRGGPVPAACRGGPSPSAPIAAPVRGSCWRRCWASAMPPVPDAILVAKGNCGIPEYRDGHICYSGTPEIMADYARLARDCGARIIGGCCGTTRGARRGHAPSARHRRAGLVRPSFDASLRPWVPWSCLGDRRQRRRARARGAAPPPRLSGIARRPVPLKSPD